MYKKIIFIILIIFTLTNIYSLIHNSDKEKNNIFYAVGSFSRKITNKEFKSMHWIAQKDFQFSLLRKNEDLLIKYPPIPDSINNPKIYFETYLNGFQLYFGNKLFFTHGNLSGNNDANIIYCKEYEFPIKEPNEPIIIRIHYDNPINLGKLRNITIGSNLDIMHNKRRIVKTETANIIFGSAFLLCAILSFLFFFQNRKKKFMPIFAIGLFFLFLSINNFSSIILYLFLNIQPISFVKLIGINTILYLFSLAYLLYTTGGKKHPRLFWILLIIHILIFIAFSLFFFKYYAFEIIFQVVTIFSSLSFIIFLISIIKHQPLRFHLNKLAKIGLSICFLFIFADLVLVLSFPARQSLNDKFYFYDFGIIMFVITMFYTFFEDYKNNLEQIFNYSYQLEVIKNKLLEIQKDKLKSQMEAIKSKLDPHFLFNSFSTLISVIDDDKELAIDFVQELANVYRYILENQDLELLTIKEELSFINSYLFLIRIRFNDNLKLSISISEREQNYYIPTLSLQLLVENAIKHNVVSKKRPLFIKIFTEDNYLVITNNLQKKSVIEKSIGIGFQNVVERYKFFTAREVYQQTTEQEYIVKIPLLFSK